MNSGCPKADPPAGQHWSSVCGTVTGTCITLAAVEELRAAGITEPSLVLFIGPAAAYDQELPDGGMVEVQRTSVARVTSSDEASDPVACSCSTMERCTSRSLASMSLHRVAISGSA